MKKNLRYYSTMDVGTMYFLVRNLGDDSLHSFDISKMHYSFNSGVGGFVHLLKEFEIDPNGTLIRSRYSLINIFIILVVAFETYISIIYEISCVYRNVCINNKLSVKQKINKIFALVVNEKSYKFFHDGSILRCLDEIMSLRNNLLHGKIETIKIEHTKLPSNPLDLNFEDIVEVLNVFVNIMHVFRKILVYVDLMPDIFVSEFNISTFKKLDVLLYDFICVYLKKLLDKVSVESIGCYSKNTGMINSISNSEIIGGVFIKSEPEYSTNLERTCNGIDYYTLLENILTEKDRNIGSGKFLLPNYCDVNCPGGIPEELILSNIK